MSAERGPREGVSAQGTIPLPRYCSPWGILAAILSAFWGFDHCRPLAQWAVEGLPTQADEEARRQTAAWEQGCDAREREWEEEQW